MTDRADRPNRLEQKEEEMLQKALTMSRVDQRNTVVKFLVFNFQDLLNTIDLLDLNNGCTITETKYKSLLFVKIVLSGQIHLTNTPN